MEQNLAPHRARLTSRRFTWIGLGGVCALLAVIGAFVYHSLTTERISVYRNEHLQYQSLVIGQAHWNVEYAKPADPKEWGDKDKDRSRLAAAYYHRRGPLGHVLERYNWFGGPVNTYWSDARLPAALVGSLARPNAHLPVEALQQLWSEPPMGVVYLFGSSAASYARSCQWIDFYEHNSEVCELFQPRGPKRTFDMLEDAMARGVNVQIRQGHEIDKIRQGPQGFYRVLIVETGRSDNRFLTSYVRGNVSATALQAYLQATTNDGIICFHTSNAHYPVADDVVQLAKRSGLAALWAYDRARDDDLWSDAHWASEWVMVSRRAENLQYLTGPTPRWLVPPKGGRRGAAGFKFELQR